jgi:hypothetical protein
MKEKTIALLSPHHDPSGRLIRGLRNEITLLKAIFDVVCVSVSDLTDSRVLKDFDLSGIHYRKIKQTGSVSARYQAALRLGLEDAITHFLLIDFDRALHWATTFPHELEAVADQLRSSEGLTLINRSPRAFETHPLTQRETEVVVNQIASDIVDQQVDVLSGAYGMAREVAELIEKKAHKEDFGFYGQVLALPYEKGIQIGSIEVEGLEWETPDQFRDKINTVGYLTWLKNFQSLKEWEKRLTLAFEAGSALQKS